MFAALHKAGKSTEEYLRASALSWVTNSGSSDQSAKHAPQKKIPPETFPQLALNYEDPKWVEIPLSDEEDQPSPRGVLEFRKGSESDCGSYGQTGESMPYPSSNSAFRVSENSLRKRRNSTSSAHSSGRSSPSLSFNFSPRRELWTVQTKKPDNPSFGVSVIDQDEQIALNQEKEVVCSIFQSNSLEPHKGDFQMEGFSPIKDAAMSPNISTLSSRSYNAGTQTAKDCDDFLSTRTALQHQLADALNALDLTRKQADGLRNRLRTYTSSMKQQADDLRASSRSLSHALDKAKEYKMYWKNETSLKDEAKKKVEELDLRVRSLQKTLSQRDSEMKSFHQGIDTLNILLGVDSDESKGAQDKLTCTSNALKRLLDLVEKLQTEAAVSSMVSMVELKESLRKFEQEKASWISFTKANEQSVASKISILESENEMLQAKLDRVQQSSEEIRYRLSQAKTDCAGKDVELNRSRKMISTLQAAIRITEEKLLESVEGLKREVREKHDIRTVFEQRHSKLEEEKRTVECHFAKLRKFLEDKKRDVRDQTTSYEPPEDERRDSHDTYPQYCHAAIQTSHSTSEPSNVALETGISESDTETKNLRQQIADLKYSLRNIQRHFSDSEDDYLRMRGDVRQLRWACHYQEVTIQTVRAENRALRISISRLKQGNDDSKSDVLQSQSDEMSIMQQRSRSHSGSASDSERIRLQPILESCTEKSLRKDDSTLSVNSNENRSCNCADFQSIMSSVSTETDGKLDDSEESRPLLAYIDNIEQKVHAGLNVVATVNRAPAGAGSDRSRSSSKRKRVKKSHKSKLPIWRQENPANLFSAEIGFAARSSSSDSDEIFSTRDIQCPKSRNSEESFSSKTSRHNSHSSNDKPQSRRRLGIPMSEGEFARLVGSMNSNCSSPRRQAIGDASWYDDGYSSSIVDALESRSISQQQHSTLLGYDINSSSSDDEKNDEATDYEPGPELPVEECLVSYGGLSFDATKFGLGDMRQFMCDLGIAHSATEMHKFIDFLAGKVQELDDDPIWRGLHTLGKSEDWLSLKGLL